MHRIDTAHAIPINAFVVVLFVDDGSSAVFVDNDGCVGLSGFRFGPRVVVFTVRVGASETTTAMVSATTTIMLRNMARQFSQRTTKSVLDVAGTREVRAHSML